MEKRTGNSSKESRNLNNEGGGAMASGNTVHTSSHSIGLLFDQNVVQMNHNFQVGMTGITKAIPDLLAREINLKGTKLAMEEDLAKQLGVFQTLLSTK